jgi:fructokinase
MNDQTSTAPVIFGEVLYDRFPDGHAVLGGAPFNVAWHLQAFGLAPLFVSRIGNDEPGDSVAAAMTVWHMNTKALQRDSRHPTGVVDIVFEAGEPHYTIVENSAWDFIDANALPELPAYGLLYHGSLALRNAASRHAFDTLLADHAGDVFMDVNLRDPWWDRETVAERALAADWVKLNENELVLLGTGNGDIEQRAHEFLQRHGLAGLIVTLGKEGALAVTANAETACARPAASLTVVDTVGAGDAFTSVLILGISRRWPLAKTMERAQSFASQIVSCRGAIVQDPAFYRPLIDAWSLR